MIHYCYVRRIREVRSFLDLNRDSTHQSLSKKYTPAEFGSIRGGADDEEEEWQSCARREPRSLFRISLETSNIRPPILMRTVPCTFLSLAVAVDDDVPHLLPLLEDDPATENLTSLLVDEEKLVFLASHETAKMFGLRLFGTQPSLRMPINAAAVCS